MDFIGDYCHVYNLEHWSGIDCRAPGGSGDHQLRTGRETSISRNSHSNECCSARQLTEGLKVSRHEKTCCTPPWVWLTPCTSPHRFCVHPFPALPFDIAFKTFITAIGNVYVIQRILALGRSKRLKRKNRPYHLESTTFSDNHADRDCKIQQRWRRERPQEMDRLHGNEPGGPSERRRRRCLQPRHLSGCNEESPSATAFEQVGLSTWSWSANAEVCVQWFSHTISRSTYCAIVDKFDLSPLSLIKEEKSSLALF